MAEEKGRKVVTVVDVQRSGDKIIIPAKMALGVAAKALLDKEKAEEEYIQMHESVNAFIWDGALALMKAMEELFGYAKAETFEVGSFFMKQTIKPKMISIETGVDKSELVPWGRFSLPGVEGWIETGYTEKDGRIIFQLNAEVKRKFEPVIRELVELTQKLANEQSIYRGKAIRISFRDKNGNRNNMIQPSFIDLSKVKEDEVIFSDEVERAISTNLYTPIEKVEGCRNYGIPLKRGILLSGPYGTGKTLVAYTTASKCNKHGWTFLYVTHADELAEIVRFAHQYQPAVIFCEDIDRVMAGERSVEIDDILNIIDGIESKNTELMVVLTTNHVEKINKAMLRPGRLDAVINVLPPDARAVEKLLRLYGRGLICPHLELTRIGEMLKGKIPAVIRECIERSKLSALKTSHNGTDLAISEDALIDAATGMKNQMDLLDVKIKENLPDGAELGMKLVEIIKKTSEESRNVIIDNLDDIHDHVS